MDLGVESGQSMLTSVTEDINMSKPSDLVQGTLDTGSRTKQEQFSSSFDPEGVPR